MFYWLKYFPIRLWDDFYKKGYARGPYFRWLRPYTIELGDSRLNFKMPESNRVWYPFSSRKVHPETYGPWGDALKERPPHAPWLYDIRGMKLWFSQCVVKRVWYFVSPWFGGLQYQVHLYAEVVSAAEIPAFDNVNLLHPRAFETAIAEYLDLTYGTREQDRRAEYRGPCNWRILPISETIQAARFDVADDLRDQKYDLKDDLVAFPITPRQFVVITFKDYGSRGQNSDIKNGRDGRELIEKIVSSFKLEVGPQTQAQWDKVKVQCPDMSLTKEFGLLKWPVKAEDVGKSTALPDVEPMQLADKT